MNHRFKFLIALILIAAILSEAAACSARPAAPPITIVPQATETAVLVSSPTASPSPSPTASPTLTPTETPTKTPRPPTKKPPRPTSTATQSCTQMPNAAKPVSWNEIPIMPGARNGVDRGNEYAFRTSSSSEEIATYYQTELEKLCWTMTFFTPPNVEGDDLFQFKKGSKHVNIGILDASKPGLKTVIIWFG